MLTKEVPFFRRQRDHFRSYIQRDENAMMVWYPYVDENYTKARS